MYFENVVRRNWTKFIQITRNTLIFRTHHKSSSLCLDLHYITTSIFILPSTQIIFFPECWHKDYLRVFFPLVFWVAMRRNPGREFTFSCCAIQPDFGHNLLATCLFVVLHLKTLMDQKHLSLIRNSQSYRSASIHISRKISNW